MKLIDYDALEQYAVEYQERHKGDELTRGEFKLINNFMFECPKTDAIPMWWITEKYLDVLNKNKELSKAVWLVRKAWIEEQEAR